MIFTHSLLNFKKSKEENMKKKKIWKKKLNIKKSPKENAATVQFFVINTKFWSKCFKRYLNS